MIKASYPFNEICRLEALSEYNDLSWSKLPSLDHIVKLASKLFDVPMAFVSLVKEETQYFHAKIGFNIDQTDREISFCSHTILQNEILIVLDTFWDNRFHDNPLTLHKPNIRFYVGMPLRSPGGYPIGTLCLADSSPRNGFSDKDKHTLEELAKLAMDSLEMHRLEIARRVGQRRFEGIANNSPDCILCADHNGLITFWNPTSEIVFGYNKEEITGKSIDFLLPEDLRGKQAIKLAKTAHGQNPQQTGKTIEITTLSKSGERILCELSLSMWFDNEEVAFGAIIRDIRERRHAEQKLFKLAHLDPLTELPNRAVLKSRIEEHIKNSISFGLMLIDLDNFKEVNDTAGHPVGDEVLKHAARRLLGMVRSTDTVSRLGGDEFAVIFHDVGNNKSINNRAQSIIECLQQPFSHNGKLYQIGGSLGLAIYPIDALQPDELVSNADMALYQAKLDGKNRWHRFDPVLRYKALEARRIREDLREAVHAGQFEMYYQPQVSLKNKKLIGAEALIRWNHPVKGLLLPAEFINELENSWDAEQVAFWIIEESCKQALKWRNHVEDFHIAVNVFSKQLASPYFSNQLIEIIRKCGIPPCALEIEVTENISLNDEENILKNLQEIFEIGIGIAFDDYGTGFASLSVLRNFPLTKIKIDKSFVANMKTSNIDAVIVKSIIQLGKGLGYSVIAEGIESAADAQRLIAKGCLEGQGYFFGRPMTADNFENKFFNT